MYPYQNTRKGGVTSGMHVFLVQYWLIIDIEAFFS